MKLRITWMVELGESPIDETQLALFVINHYIVRLNISVHYSIRVTEIQSFQQLKYIIPNVIVGQRRVQLFEIEIVDMFEDERRSF
jgi:hypothetical protein